MKNKFFALLLSLLISFGLWLYVVTIISPESEATFYDIPVELVGTDYLDAHDLIIVSDTKNLKMDLKLRGNRSDLNKLSSSNITIIADLSKIKSAGKHQIDCTVSFQSGTAEVISQEPESITVEVATQVSKNVDVKVIYTGSVPEGYELDKTGTTLNHTSVEVKGTQEMVEKIEFAGITVDMSDKMTSFANEYAITLYGSNALPLLDTQYVGTDISKVTALIQVNKVKKVSLQFELDDTDSGMLKDMVMLYYEKEVTVIGNDETLAEVDSSYTLTIKLSDYTQTTTQTFKLPLPEGARCKEEIKVQIEVPNMITISQKLDTSRFVLKNVPTEWQVSLSGTPLVEIYGPEDELNKLRNEQLRIIMDCSAMMNETDLEAIRYTVESMRDGRPLDYLKVNVTWGKNGVIVQLLEDEQPPVEE